MHNRPIKSLPVWRYTGTSESGFGCSESLMEQILEMVSFVFHFTLIEY